jgi:RNA polymerase sigma factor (sigma-70 family)
MKFRMTHSEDKGEGHGEPASSQPAGDELVPGTPPEGSQASPPPNVQASGTVDRAAVPPLEDAPRYGTFDEVYAEFENYVYVTAAQRLGGDTTAAEDACQGVWLRFSQRIRREGSVPDPFVPVLLGLVDDEVRNHLRGERRRRISGEPDENAPPSSKPDPHRLLSAAEEQAKLEREVRYILSRMDRHAARVLQLDHMEDLPLKGIAAIVGRSVGTVSKDLCRARAKFKELYLRLRRKT